MNTRVSLYVASSIFRSRNKLVEVVPTGTAVPVVASLLSTLSFTWVVNQDTTIQYLLVLVLVV